jgi:Ulp1 family protease
MNTNELKHYGILGMKWGRRRASNDSSGSTKKKDRQPETKESLSKKKAYVDSAKSVTTEVKNINQSLSKFRNTKNRVDLSTMSNDEIRKHIERFSLEQSYASYSDKSVTKGKEYIDQTLDIAGSVLAIGSTALGMALVIKQLKS